MKRLVVSALIAALALQSAAPAFAARVRVVHRGPHRTTVVVRPGFPLRRPLHVCVVRRPRVAVVVTPGIYLAPVFWTAAIIALPPRERLVWEDSETLVKDEDWTDFTLNVNDRGEKLYFELAGKAQLDFAEVVFGNGETQVVDFREYTRGPGIYSLLDFRDGRQVSHVRLVARAKSGECRIIVRMAK